MPDDYTYTPPDESLYFKAILTTLNKRGYSRLHNQLKNARCSIRVSSSFSRKRWNATYTTIVFQMPLEEFDKFDTGDEKSKQVLISICDDLMPPEAGLDVMDVEFSLALETLRGTKTLESDLAQISTQLAQVSTQFALPSDIMEKGRQMAEVYLYLYTLENYIRLFVHTVSSQHYGPDYFSKLTIPRSIGGAITLRKEQEAKNQWISIRGDAELFYLDFKDLGTLILNNWDIFRMYFPDQAWISSKIDELANCRNLVAHNSFVGDHERDVIRVNFRSIVRQLTSYIK